MKGFKVTDTKRSKTVGIACQSLSELITKGKVKFDIPPNNAVGVFLIDGTEIDTEDYFQSLPNQTIVILKQNLEDIPTGADLIYSALKHVNIEIIRTGEKIQDFFDESIKEKVLLLAKIICENTKKNREFLSNKIDDPDWFLGLETNANTKEAFMFRRSQERIRGYFYKSKSDVKKSSLYLSNEHCKKTLDKVFSSLICSLNKDKYFGCYFDRTEAGALCDKQGYFKCAGVWKSCSCAYENGEKRHVINPYSSREERIVFSTWNLDHCIERSRTIIPTLINTTEMLSKSQDKAEVNVQYFYSLLFTSSNLRLVHIVCHDKGKHFSAQCDLEKCIIKC